MAATESVSNTLPRGTLNFLLVFVGAVHALSFAPGPLPAFALPFLQLVALAIFIGSALTASSQKQASLTAFCFGIGNFTVGVYWLYISMHVYGLMPSVLAASAVVLMAMALSAFIIAAVLLIRYLLPRAKYLNWQEQILGAAVIASVWTLSEWLRGTLFTGFPWLNIAYAHVDGMFAGWAPLFGAYAVAWCAAFSVGSISLFAINTEQRENGLSAAAMGCAVVLGIAGIAFSNIKWADAHGDPIIVRLVQGNVSQSLKFDPEHLSAGIQIYQELSALPAKEAGSEPSLIVLPETVVPLLQNRIAPEVWQQWIDIAKNQNAQLLLGAPLESGTASPQYTNSVIAIDGKSTPEQIINLQLEHRYDKSHLVPFGEFVPYGFKWFVDAMQIPLGDFHRGEHRQQNFDLAGQYIAPNVCYEDVFGEEIVRAVLPNSTQGPGATMLINVSNLAWFGDSWALRQHLQISRFRAIETARPMLRATNTGMTAAIDHRGKVLGVLPANQLGVLDVEVQGATGLTAYVRWGNLPIIVLSLLLCGWAWLRFRKPQA
ncbi:apolipoprotein N-acyltransferase [Paenalcaligenes niemegkensis]|uniref:apolipoprotein N-acyltransferase n=1 Tax=Paenalcaligenes niemegkensis TaxID=2895469 RepID=UPI001EE8089F|nr:apolipoprotein N-acyltransferase [Paenalcaligenes niemegkensis]MCQ9617171.1 apolipoprotein N-acyltransferase [Paenalcaligenes niemegkensis]